MSDLLPIRATFVAGAPEGQVSDADLALINATTAKPFRAEAVFVFSCVMSTGELDDHCTRMGVSSLRNYGTDARRGRPYLVNHRTDEGIFGYTYDGHYEEVQNQARAAVFIPRGRMPAGKDGRSSNQEIADLMAGMRREVSVRFGGPLTECRCDLCGNDVFSLECMHLPGMRFDGVLATATVENAQLAEVSGVWSGSNPSALIGKAEELRAKSRFSTREWRGWCERMHIPDAARFISLPPTPPPAKEGKEKKPMREALQALAAAVAAQGFARTSAALLAAPEDVNLPALLDKELRAELQARADADPFRAACLAAKVKDADELTEKLAQASEYETSVRAETKKYADILFEARGAAMHPVIDSMDFKSVKSMRDTYGSQIDERFPNKRQTTPPEPNATNFATGGGEEEALTPEQQAFDKAGERVAANYGGAAGNNGRESK